MHYYRIQFSDTSGAVCLSDPITTWTDAELYRRAIGGDATLLRY